MKRRNLSNEYFPHINGLIKQLKIFLQSVAKKQDVFRIFTDWPRQEFDLPDAKNFKCSAVVIVRLLVLIMKDKVEELSNTDIKTFAIGTGDAEVIDRTIGESFGFCCQGVEPEFFAESTNALLFPLISPMNIILNVIALTNIPCQSSGIISIKLPC